MRQSGKPEERNIYHVLQEEKIFALGPGRLYIAPAGIPENKIRSLLYYAGPTKGGVTLKYETKIHEITDYRGKVIRAIPYGERLRAEGKLARLNPHVLADAIGAPYEKRVLSFGGRRKAGRATRLRLMLVCAIPPEAGGGEFVFSMICTAASGTAFTLSADRDCSYTFSLLGESDGAGMIGKAVIG